MISEPELDGDWQPARPAGAARAAGEDGETGETGGAGERPRAHRPPWWWVAGAVVVTSALWAGGLQAFGDRGGDPEVRYRVVDDLCARFPAVALSEALGGFSDAAPVKGERHPALDWASCSRDGGGPDGSGGFFVAALVELHRKSDPGPEFAVGSSYDRLLGGVLEPWESVPGLGEEALVNAAGADDGVHLRVRDGGAVFTFEVMFYGEASDASGPEAKPSARPDRETLIAAVAEDARALMADLRTD
ncbi:hypothetical protein ACIA6E_06270 [Streptomyces sp. NPDC051815]|uniref:hypothetical protein n=1 Tax=Streptomyces sp. NPDC051815 TaxID=3365674 RepID=UPI0037A84167